MEAVQAFAELGIDVKRAGEHQVTCRQPSLQA